MALDLRSPFAPDRVVRPGQHVGKYVLGELIARGGMAEVWGARVEGPQGFVKSFALKFVLESFTGDSDLERLFVNEARLAAQLQHANLVSVFDFDRVPDPDGSSVSRYFIAMERIDGHDLRRVLQTAHHRGVRLPPSLSLHVAGEVLKGLRYVHERRDPETQHPLGLIHRDVSPHNILVGFAGEVKLSDFGIAKAMTQNLGTQSGTIRGKLAYASPEQLRAEPLDHRTDQFALGVTLWEALAGQRLFEGVDELEIMSKVIKGAIPPLPGGAGVDPTTEAVVRRMLAPAARDRFPTTGDALSAILAAPGYTADSAPLVSLLHELFHPTLVELPRTAPLEPDALEGPEAPVVARGGGTLRHDALLETSPLEPSEPSLSAAGGVASSPSGRRATPAPGTVPLPEIPREPTRSTTGSAYVSGAVPNEMMVAARGRPATWVALGVLAAGVLTGGLVLVGRRMAAPPGAASENAEPRAEPPRATGVEADRTTRERSIPAGPAGESAERSGWDRVAQQPRAEEPASGARAVGVGAVEGNGPHEDATTERPRAAAGEVAVAPKASRESFEAKPALRVAPVSRPATRRSSIEAGDRPVLARPGVGLLRRGGGDRGPEEPSPRVDPPLPERPRPIERERPVDKPVAKPAVNMDSNGSPILNGAPILGD